MIERMRKVNNVLVILIILVVIVAFVYTFPTMGLGKLFAGVLGTFPFFLTWRALQTNGSIGMVRAAKIITIFAMVVFALMILGVFAGARFSDKSFVVSLLPPLLPLLIIQIVLYFNLEALGEKKSEIGLA